MTQNILMLHIGRCGSTALSRMLGQHSEIDWQGEVYWRSMHNWEAKGGKVGLNDGKFQPWQPHNKTREAYKAPFSPLAVLGRSMINSDHDNYGFELKFYHMKAFNLNFESYMDYLQRIGFDKIIFLTRKNTLKQVVSYVRARATDRMHLNVGEKPNRRVIELPINNVEHDYDKRKLIDILQTFDEDIERFRKWAGSRDFLELNYEEHVEEDPMVAFNEILAYLDLPVQPHIKVQTVRATPFPLRETVSNFEEVELALADTPYAWMTK